MLKFSIITVCYNSEQTIAETISSVNCQSFRNYEHIIIDGLSTDTTLDIVNFSKDKKTVVFSEKDEGLYDAMNKGILKAKGEYLAFLNSDDRFINNYVLEKVNLIAKSDPDFIYGGINYFSENAHKQRIWMPDNFNIIKKKKLQIPHPCIFIKRDKLIEKNRFFDTNLKIASDLKQQLEFIHIDNRAGVLINEVLVDMRLGGKSTDGLLAFLTGWRESVVVYKEIFGLVGLFFCIRKILYKLPQIKNIVYFVKPN